MIGVVCGKWRYGHRCLQLKWRGFCTVFCETVGSYLPDLFFADSDSRQYFAVPRRIAGVFFPPFGRLDAVCSGLIAVFAFSEWRGEFHAGTSGELSGD